MTTNMENTTPAQLKEPLPGTIPATGRRRKIATPLTDRIQEPEAPTAVPRRLLVTVKDVTHVCRTADIEYLHSASNYTHIFMASGEEYRSSRNIMQYEDILCDHPDFLRVHRSCIINKQYVETIFRKEGKVMIALKGGYQLAISKERKRLLLRQLML